jgi:hypothetical protein
MKALIALTIAVGLALSVTPVLAGGVGLERLPPDAMALRTQALCLGVCLDEAIACASAERDLECSVGFIGCNVSCSGLLRLDQADLVPLTPPPPPGARTLLFCTDVNGPLQGIVRVLNQGAGVANDFTTRVTFLPGGDLNFSNLTPLGPGEFRDFGPFDIPLDCYNPDCEFRIRVDVNGEVPESNEDNNTAFGRCIS